MRGDNEFPTLRGALKFLIPTPESGNEAVPAEAPPRGAAMSLFGFFTSAAAAVTASTGLGTILLYLTGLGYRQGYLERFGINIGRFERDFTGTLVEGLLALTAVIVRWWGAVANFIWLLLALVAIRAAASAVPPAWSAWFARFVRKLPCWVKALLALVMTTLAVVGVGWQFDLRLVLEWASIFSVCAGLALLIVWAGLRSAHVRSFLLWSEMRHSELGEHLASDPFKQMRLLGWVQTALVVSIAYPVIPILLLLTLAVPSLASKAGWADAAATQRWMDGFGAVGEPVRADSLIVADSTTIGVPVFSRAIGIVMGSNTRKTYRSGDTTVVEAAPDTTLYGRIIACSSAECAFYTAKTVRIIQQSEIKEMVVEPCAELRGQGRAEILRRFPSCAQADTAARQ